MSAQFVPEKDATNGLKPVHRIYASGQFRVTALKRSSFHSDLRADKNLHRLRFHCLPQLKPILEKNEKKYIFIYYHYTKLPQCTNGYSHYDMVHDTSYGLI